MHVLTYPHSVDLVALKREIVEIRRMSVMGIYSTKEGGACLVFASEPSFDEKLILDSVVKRTRVEDRLSPMFCMERRGE